VHLCVFFPFSGTSLLLQSVDHNLLSLNLKTAQTIVNSWILHFYTHDELSLSGRSGSDLDIGIYFFIASGVGLSPLYCGHFWPIVPAPDDRCGWLWSNWWNEDWQGKPKYSEQTCPSATLSTTNPTWPDPGSNPGRRDGKPATTRLSYGAAIDVCNSVDRCYWNVNKQFL
jgi:hypothetical protein